MARKFIKGDNVMITVGDDKGKISRITLFNSSKNKVILDGLNLVTKTVKANSKNIESGLLRKESYLHISNISHLSDGKLSRVGFKMINNKKTRFMKKNMKVLINDRVK
jgi:large subunit ribosomal protein L24